MLASKSQSQGSTLYMIQGGFCWALDLDRRMKKGGGARPYPAAPGEDMHPGNHRYHEHILFSRLVVEARAVAVATEQNL